MAVLAACRSIITGFKATPRFRCRFGGDASGRDVADSVDDSRLLRPHAAYHSRHRRVDRVSLRGRFRGRLFMPPSHLVSFAGFSIFGDFERTSPLFSRAPGVTH